MFSYNPFADRNPNPRSSHRPALRRRFGSSESNARRLEYHSEGVEQVKCEILAAQQAFVIGAHRQGIALRAPQVKLRITDADVVPLELCEIVPSEERITQALLLGKRVPGVEVDLLDPEVCLAPSRQWEIENIANWGVRLRLAIAGLNAPGLSRHGAMETTEELRSWYRLLPAYDREELFSSEVLADIHRASNYPGLVNRRRM